MIAINNIYSLLEIGKRKNLEDYIFPNHNTATLADKVFLVCDGVGGENKGEVASKITADTFGDHLSGINNVTEQDLKLVFDQVLQNIQNYINIHPEAAKMSTTLTLAVIKEDRILVAWCGDSKIYFIRNNEIVWKSKDHSLVQYLVDTHEISEEEAKTNPNRNVILRTISANTTIDKIDFYELNNIENNDFILLATDGFFEQVTDELLLDSLKYPNLINAELFLNLCKERTNDNFSMYLIHLSNVSDEL